MEKRNKGLGKRITAFTLAAILLATSTDYSVFADEIQAENTELENAVDATEVDTGSESAVAATETEVDAGSESEEAQNKEADIEEIKTEAVDSFADNSKVVENNEDEISTQTIDVQSSLTYEPIMINSKTLNASTIYGQGDTSFTMDADGGFYSLDKFNNRGAFPNDGKITTSDGVTYQLTWTGSRPYQGNDSIRLEGTKSGSTVTSSQVTMNLSSYGAYNKVYILGTAGGFADNSKSLNFAVTLTYTDGYSKKVEYSLYDWYKLKSYVENLGYGYKIFSRLNKDGKTLDKDYGNNGGPMLQSKAIECDQNRLLKSISFQISKTDASVANSNGIYAAIYGVTGAINNTAPATPTGVSATATDNSIDIMWSKVDKATGYVIDVSEYSNFNDNNGNPSFVVSNKAVTGGDTTSCEVTGLTSGKTYYYRVRAVGTGGQSLSSSARQISTLSTQTISYNSNGGTGTMANTIIVQNQSANLSANSFTKEDYVFNGWNIKADGSGTAYTDKQSLSNTETSNSTLTLYAQWLPCGEVNLLNQDYAYGSSMSSSSVTLNVDVDDSSKVGYYIWQMASSKDVADSQWTNISDKIISSEHNNRYEINSSDKLKDGYWYRCIVNGKTKTKPVQLLIANGAVMTNVTRSYAYRQWYVSNGYVAYTSTATNFDVLGKYEKSGKYYWLQTSYSSGWRMYTDTSEAPAASSYYGPGCSLNELRVAFSDTDKFNMQFEALLGADQKSFAFGCDTMLGNYQTSGSYSDYASLKAVKDSNNNDTVQQIQMVGAYSVDTAKAEDTSFVLKYVNGYTPSYYWLGRYYNRKVWTNSGSIDDVINTDSGMTSSWCNVTGGSVKFEFHVGAVSDTGAQITINAKSETNSITIYNPDSNYSYALYKYVDGREEEISSWESLSGNKYTYSDLEPNTKYVLKAQKNGESVSLDIYTKIDTETGSNSGKIEYTATSSSLKFTNVKDSYQYALEDAYGNKVTGYKTPDNSEVNFSGLKAGTTYYLVAKSGENELSEKVKAITLKAKIEFDANTKDSVTDMPGAVEKSYGTAVPLPNSNPVRSGYKFAGWTNETYKNQKVVLYRAGSTFRGETDITLYAVWYDENESIDTTATYSVSFNKNAEGDVSVPANGTKNWGTPFVISESVPVRTGYDFKEWNTQSDGKGQIYNPGDSYLLNENLTLYAIWEDKYQSVTVEQSERYTYSVNGGTSGKVKYGDNAEIVFSANDTYDFSEIKVYVNGGETELTGTFSDNKRKYTVNISNITEDKYITVSGIYPSSIAVDKDKIDFGSKVEFQQVPDAVTVTVTNDGEKAVTLNSIACDEENCNFVIGSLSKEKLETGESATFTVQPKATEIDPGVYAEKINITTTTGVRKVVEVTFTVEDDNVAPSGTIKLTSSVGSGDFTERSWDTLWDIANQAGYSIYYNSDVVVNLTADDSGSGIGTIMYCIAKKGMTREELERLDSSSWKEYSEALTLEPYQTAVFYAKLTDKAGNVSYISTEGIVLDNYAPVITDEKGNNVINNAVYTGTQVFTFDNSDSIIDTNEERKANDILTVTVDGKEVKLSEDGSYSFVPRSKSYNIVAKDRAGNTTSVDITVNWNMIDVPSVGSKEYTGNTLKSDIEDTAIYEVSSNNGGIDVGEYDVVLTLKDTVNNKWKSADGCVLNENETIVTSKFNIFKADNEFTKNLTCDNYVYDKSEPKAAASAKFGTVSYKYYNSENDDVIKGVPTDAGSYYVIASVEDCANYGGLTSDKVYFTISNASQDAPSNIEAIDETIDDKADGQIRNLTTTMQWRIKSASAGVAAENEYRNVEDPNMTFADGTYEVRYAAKKNFNASEPFEVTIKAGRKLDISVPTEQIGYELKSDVDSVSWRGTASFTFKVNAGYSKCDNFVIKINNKDVVFTENEDGNAQYTINDITEDTKVEVIGVADITAPTGKVTVGNIDPWTDFLNTVTFNRFFKETQNVSIEANDAGSGVKEIAYYVYESTADKEALTHDEIVKLADGKWKVGSDFKVDQDKKFVIYARLTDKDNNVSYISSDGIILDETAPVVDGIEAGESYCEDTVIKVSDANIAKVTYSDGGKEIELKPTNGNEYKLPIKDSTPLHGSKDVTVAAFDKAGNQTIINIKAEHDYSFEYVVPPTVLDNGWTTHVCRRNGHQCGQTYDDNVTQRLGADGLIINDKAALEKVNKDAQQRIDKNKYADDAEKNFYQEIVDKSKAMLDDIKGAEDLKQEIDNINIPDIDNPTANDIDKLNDALTKIEKLLDEEDKDTPTSSLTEEQKKELEELKESIKEKQNTIEEVKESIKFIKIGDDKTYGVNDINKIDDIKPEHQDAIEAIIDEINNLIDKNGSNLTDEQKDTLDNYNEQMLEKLKDAAKKDIEEELEKTNAQIKSSILDEQQQTEALEKAKEEAVAAKNKIDEAETKADLINSREDGKLNLELITGNKDELAESVKNNIERIFEEKKNEIENMVDLSAKQKKDALSKLDDEKSEALNAVTDAESKDDIVNAFETVNSQFDELIDTNLEKDLANAKNKASDEITKKADAAKEAIDAMPNLTKDEKVEAKKKIDEQAKAAKEELDTVTDPAKKSEVGEKKNTSIDSLDKTELDAANNDIKNLKEAAKSDIIKNAEEAKAAIDAMPDLTPEQKKTAKAEVDKKAEEAKSAIDAIEETTDKTQAEQIRADIKSQKDAVSEVAKKQQEESLKQDLANAIDNAQAEIDKKADDAKAAIDAMPNLSDEEKVAAKAEIDKQAEAAKKDLESVTDPALKDNVSIKKDLGFENLDKAETDATNNDISNMKESAKADIDNAAKEAKDAIDAMPDLTPEQKKTAKAEVDKKAEEAKSAIDAIEETTDKTQAEQIRADIKSQKDAVSEVAKKQQEESLKQDLANAVDKAQAEIDKKAEDAKAAIDAMPNLSDKEKADAKKNVDDQADEAKKDLETVTDPALKGNISSKKESGFENLDKTELDAANNDINNMKEAAKADIDKTAEEAKAEIDKMTDLTTDQKQAAKDAIDAKAEAAKNTVESIKDTTDKNLADTIRQEIEKQKTEVSTETKKQQEESAKQDAINATDNQAKTEDAVNKTTTIIDNIKVSATEKEEIKEEIKSELKKAELDNVGVEINDFKKVPATLHETGKITGTIEIKAGSAIKTVDIDKELPALSTSVSYESKVTEEAPKTDVTVNENALMDKVLTDNDLDTLAKGGSSDITLLVQNKEIEESDTDKKLVEEVLADNEQVGKYLDVSLLLKVTDADGNVVVDDEKIHNPDTEFTITVSVPSELLLDNANISRTYQIVRVHDGKAEMLESVYDEATKTITFVTDRFSTYAITYTDTDVTPVTPEKPVADNNITTQPITPAAKPQVTQKQTTKKASNTGDNNATMLFVIMMFAGAGVVLLGRKKKVNR